MGTINEHLNNLLNETKELSSHVTQSNEFITVEDVKQAINSLELTIHEARKAFENTEEMKR